MPYVDDCMFTSNSESLIYDAINDLQKAGVDIKLLGDLDHFLGVQHTRTGNHSMTLYRPPNSTLKNNESKTKFPTPSYQCYLNKEQLHNAKLINFPIRSNVGDLIFSALSVPPDLTFATTYLSKLIEHLNVATWKLCSHVEYYFKDTANMKLHFNVNLNSSLQFSIYCNSDSVSDPITRCNFVFRGAITR